MITTLDLYRSGNGTWPEVDKIRSVDVAIFANRNVSEIWIKADRRGISMSSAPKSSWKHVWRLPSGSPYDHKLLLWEDTPGHWVFAAASDMRGSFYLRLLRDVGVRFEKVR